MTARSALATKADRRRRLVPYALLAPGMLWLLVFYVVPMFRLAITSLQEGSLEQGYQFTGNLDSYASVFTTYLPQLRNSLMFAFGATVIGLLIAYPLAYAIAFYTSRWKSLFLLLILVPLLVPFLLRTLAWRVILADQGVVVTALKTIGLLPENGRLLSTGWAILAGLVYNYLAFMALPIYVSLDKIEPSLLEAANDLYASPWTAFRKVTLPMSMPGVISGTLLTFIPAAGDYVNVELLGNRNWTMMGNVIQSKFLVIIDYPAAAAISFTLMAIIVTMVVLYVRKVGTEELLT
ncbi:MAG: ABC transporter permease [Acidimicrobiia bacterium]|nr:ABC transporter permease [Acidimicrobiia bacterium]